MTQEDFYLCSRFMQGFFLLLQMVDILTLNYLNYLLLLPPCKLFMMHIDLASKKATSVHWMPVEAGVFKALFCPEWHFIHMAVTGVKWILSNSITLYVLLLSSSF